MISWYYSYLITRPFILRYSLSNQEVPRDFDAKEHLRTGYEPAKHHHHIRGRHSDTKDKLREWDRSLMHSHAFKIYNRSSPCKEESPHKTPSSSDLDQSQRKISEHSTCPKYEHSWLKFEEATDKRGCHRYDCACHLPKPHHYAPPVRHPMGDSLKRSHPEPASQQNTKRMRYPDDDLATRKCSGSCGCSSNPCMDQPMKRYSTNNVYQHTLNNMRTAERTIPPYMAASSPYMATSSPYMAASPPRLARFGVHSYPNHRVVPYGGHSGGHQKQRTNQQQKVAGEKKTPKGRSSFWCQAGLDLIQVFMSWIHVMNPYKIFIGNLSTQKYRTSFVSLRDI